MTTATRESTTPTTDALLADIQRTHAEIQKTLNAMLDPLDIPGSWTERQKGADRERRVRLAQHVTWANTLTEQLAKAAGTRAALTPGRDRLWAAQVTIEKQIADAPDYREIADARASTAEWARQNELAASLTAIKRGVEYFNGQPALPGPLRELLTDVCAHCGHAELKWPGPLGPLEEDVEKAEALIATGSASLASLVANVKPWLDAVRLDETVST